MNIIRSPKSCKSKQLSTGESSSQPDLSKISEVDDFFENVSRRKRKTPDCDYANQFDNFKAEILEILKESSKSHCDSIRTIHENITSINDNLKDIKTSTDLLIAENKELKQQIMALTDTVEENKGKIVALETEVQKLKLTKPNTQISHQASLDEVLTEFHDRTERSKNIIIVGIPESHIENSKDRQVSDQCEAYKVLKSIYPSCPEAEKIIRLGKYVQKKSRPLKVYFANHDTPKIILKNKSKLQVEGVHLFSDQTPLQQKHIKELSTELKSRQEQGENDLIIKYIKGTPRIIKQSAKNYTQQATKITR